MGVCVLHPPQSCGVQGAEHAWTSAFNVHHVRHGVHGDDAYFKIVALGKHHGSLKRQLHAQITGGKEPCAFLVQGRASGAAEALHNHPAIVRDEIDYKLH